MNIIAKYNYIIYIQESYIQGEFWYSGLASEFKRQQRTIGILFFLDDFSIHTHIYTPWWCIWYHGWWRPLLGHWIVKGRCDVYMWERVGQVFFFRTPRIDPGVIQNGGLLESANDCLNRWLQRAIPGPANGKLPPTQRERERVPNIHTIVGGCRMCTSTPRVYALDECMYICMCQASMTRASMISVKISRDEKKSKRYFPFKPRLLLLLFTRASNLCSHQYRKRMGMLFVDKPSISRLPAIYIYISMRKNYYLLLII